MRRKNITLICLTTTFLSLLLLCFIKTTTIHAESMTSADVTELHEKDDKLELTVNYELGSDPTLIFQTSEKDVIDFDALKKELSSENVSVDSDNQKVTVKLAPSENKNFKLAIANNKAFKLEAFNGDEKSLFYQTFNEDEPTSLDKRMNDPEHEDDEGADSGWIKTKELRLSKGPILNHKNGSTTQPYLYFGDYEMAKANQTIADAYSPKGKARKNSLTAANFAVLYSSPGARIEDGPEGDRNHIYTSHYGDNQKADEFFEKQNIEDRPVGSPNSFISNNIYNSVVKTDNWLMPGTSGPDKNGYSFAMAGKPSFYFRVNPITGFEEQRMVYLQKAYPVETNNRENRKIETTITHSFNSAGKVVTKIDFKNVGDRVFNNFSGFSNHDLSLNKDGREIEKTSRKLSAHEKAQLNKIGNYVPMRSLGGDRGMYIESGNKEVRTSIFTNYPQGPKAWAARSIGKSYLATKGFMHTIGIGPLLETKERYYPWKSGKPHYISHIINVIWFYNSSTNRYNSPFVPRYKFNAFENQRDPGDKGTSNALIAGKRLGADEKEELWDAGLTMRTAPQDLLPEKTVSLEYAAQTDINDQSAVPVIELDHQGTHEDPELVMDMFDHFTIKGSWYDFDSKYTTMKYSIDDSEFKNAKELFKGVQKESDFGKIHEFSIDDGISIKDLNRKRNHTLRLQMTDWEDEYHTEGNKSRIKETVFRFIQPATDVPQITVTSPHSTPNDPHNPFNHALDIKGVWNDADSEKIKSITYSIDGGKEKPVETSLDNPTLSAYNNWEINALDIKEHNDFEIHKIDFKIVDHEGNIGTDEIHFQHEPGSMYLTAPEKIDFGEISVSNDYGSKVKPKITQGRVILTDFRKKDATPAGVSLTMSKFYKNVDDPNDGDDDDEDEDFNDSNSGGDSELTGDPDRMANDKERLTHRTYWKNQLVKPKNLIIGQTKLGEHHEWEQTSDFTDDILNNLRLNFKASKTGSTPGNYVSHWTWQTVDSIQ